MEILFYILAAFVGYVIGRIGHIYFGHLNYSPHHWIFGIILIILGLVYYKYSLGLYAFSFGVGHFISDFKDFLKFKIIGPDEVDEKKFWGID